MGIFDDAIRQHLDLKRRQGADESELQQLEDEAFGLPARPGDPDFPGSEEAPSDTADGEPAPLPVDGEPAPLPADEPGDATAPHGDALLAEPEAEPPPPPPEGPVEDEGASSFTTSERAAISQQPTEFFEPPEPLELEELDLELEDERDAGTPVDELEVVEETEAVSDEAELSDDVQLPDEPESPLEPELSDEPESPIEPPEDEGSEDVLEETPEFLRDNPDDDELWFEQGEPKDFDF